MKGKWEEKREGWRRGKGREGSGYVGKEIGRQGNR